MERTPEAIHQDLQRRLREARRREERAGLLRGTALTGAVALGAAASAVILEELLHLDPLPRTLLVAGALLSVAGAAARYVGVPLLRRVGLLASESDEQFARRIGQSIPGVQDRLVNLLHLFRERGDTAYYSLPLTDAAVVALGGTLAPIDIPSAVDIAGARRGARLFGLVSVVALILFLAFPGALRDAGQRLLDPTGRFEPPPPFTFEVDPGNREVARGENVPVTIRIVGRAPSSIVFSSRPAGQITSDDLVLNAEAGAVFRTEFKALKLSTRYQVRSGDVHSAEYLLSVVERPVVRSLRVVLTPPSYTGLPVRELDENIGDITALRGTRAAFVIDAGKDLAAAALVFADSSRRALQIDGRQATGILTLQKETSYHLLLHDADGRMNADPIRYTIRIVPDAAPTAAILVPGMNVDVAGQTHLNLLVRIGDDFGFTTLRLAHRLVRSRYEQPQERDRIVTIPIPDGIRTEGEIAYRWPLEELSLVPEDVVSYYVEVLDNDRVAGPKAGRSETYTLRLPSMEEVFADIDRSQERGLEGMREALEQARQARRELEALQQEVRANQQKPTWQQQKKAEEVARKYEEARKKIEEATREVERMVEEMQKNRVLSQETMEKYMELQQLMQEMDSPEFAEAMKKLQQAMQQISPEAMNQAMQQFSFSEENFRKSIERTMNLLKRIQIEQKVDELVHRAEEIARRQEDLERKTSDANAQDRANAERLAEEQKELQRQLERLGEELSELQKKMEEFPSEMPLEEMENARRTMEESGMHEQMQQSEQALRQQQMSTAREQQRSARQGMGRMQQSLQQMQQALRENQQRQVANAMRRAFQDLMELSRRQEALKEATAGLDPGSRGFRENAQEQMSVLRDLGTVTESLGRLSQKTFGVSPEMGKALGDAMRQMGQAMESLEGRNGTAGAKQQAGAMASLNAAASLVQGAMQAMMQGSGQGMGMAGFMQRLGQLSGMQQGINQGTRNAGGQMSGRAGDLGRLAGEQGMVRKSLEQLAREASVSGDLSKMLGDLNRAAQEMREVQTDLAQGSVKPETLRKQDRILSRLLDSQRSARERDFEKRRRAESGKTVPREGPAGLDRAAAEGRTRLQQDLLKALEEGYGKDYQELIRRYFEELEKEPSGNGYHHDNH